MFDTGSRFSDVAGERRLHTYTPHRPTLPPEDLYHSLELKIVAATEAVKMSALKLPIAYKLFFLYIEPVSALVGSYYAFFKPDTYLMLTHAQSSPSTGIPLATQVVLAQLSNLYFLFAINEAFVLRSTQDLRVWRTLLSGLLVADLGHLYSVNALGPEVYWKVPSWTAMDWGNVAFVYLGATMRIAFLLGLGIPTSATFQRKKTREPVR